MLDYAARRTYRRRRSPRTTRKRAVGTVKKSMEVRALAKPVDIAALRRLVAGVGAVGAA